MMLHIPNSTTKVTRGLTGIKRGPGAAELSSRVLSMISQWVIKPDMTAPDLNIVAVWDLIREVAIY